jgi:hypothetical protein
MVVRRSALKSARFMEASVVVVVGRVMKKA